MNCNEALNLVAARVDRQPLDAAQDAALDQHLAGCAACRAELESQRAVSAAVRANAEMHRMPPALRARLRSSLPQEKEKAPMFGWLLAGSGGGTLRLGGAFAAGAVLTLALQFAAAGYGARNNALDEAVSAHVRSLMAQHLEDVISTDRHTVKPWFAGKLDFSPPVVDLAAQGFPLTGGRLDYLDDHVVAALVYKRQQHVINVFVWPDSEGRNSPPSAETRRGYNAVHWRAKAMNFWAVSDLNTAELETLATQLSTTE